MEPRRWDIVILGGARDFHAVDWYRAIRRICPERQVVFVTDLFGSEGYQDLTRPEDKVERLFIIDRLLFSNSSSLGNYWRNVIKLIVSPLQAFRLRRLIERNGCKIVHAHPMYYMFLCWMAGVPYVGTPQGDEMLLRPKKSRAYRFFASIVLRGARAVVVDSNQMKNAVKAISGVDSLMIQNGINAEQIMQIGKDAIRRYKITSIRGLDALYRIKEIITGRDEAAPYLPLTLIYPFYDSVYLPAIRSLLKQQDEDLGRLDKNRMYRLFHESLLVISIPSRDSSPRSVYEAIFSGCCVAVTNNPWIHLLPKCMRSRIYIVDLENKKWFRDALECAGVVTRQPFLPSQEALDLFDENRSLRKVVDLLY